MELSDPLCRVKITAVAQEKVGFCWPFYILPLTCCLHQQSCGALLSASIMLLNLSSQLNLFYSFKSIWTCHPFPSRPFPFLPALPLSYQVVSSILGIIHSPFHLRTLTHVWSSRSSPHSSVEPSSLCLGSWYTFNSQGVIRSHYFLCELKKLTHKKFDKCYLSVCRRVQHITILLEKN